MSEIFKGSSQLVNVVTFKWGTRYGVEYVNKLFAADRKTPAMVYFDSLHQKQAAA